MKQAWLTLLALPTLACGSSSAPEQTTAATSGPLVSAPVKTFENPGGMWMPEQLAEHAEVLKKLAPQQNLWVIGFSGSCPMV